MDDQNLIAWMIAGGSQPRRPMLARVVEALRPRVSRFKGRSAPVTCC